MWVIRSNSGCIGCGSVPLIGAHGIVVEVLLAVSATGHLVTATFHFLHLALSQHFTDTLRHHLLLLLRLLVHGLSRGATHPRSLWLLLALHVALVRHRRLLGMASLHLHLSGRVIARRAWNYRGFKIVRTILRVVRRIEALSLSAIQLFLRLRLLVKVTYFRLGHWRLVWRVLDGSIWGIEVLVRRHILAVSSHGTTRVVLLVAGSHRHLGSFSALLVLHLVDCLLLAWSAVLLLLELHTCWNWP